MKYTDEDLARARVFLNRYSPDDTDVAQLIADVRAETRREVGPRIRQLADDAEKAEAGCDMDKAGLLLSALYDEMRYLAAELAGES